MTNTITIEQLLKLCGYGTHINIKLADNGSIAINGVNCMENSKDKRQKARWEAFKNKPVLHISPSVEIADMKRHIGDCFRMIIEASILRDDYDQAMTEYKEMLKR